ncbi:hypothetical protein D9619_003515 [Psilocybe cf. subviscida]|uniref:F-box domain-containing protein n=1 Tax=Psilocybe cf. subviscida TaxID=2480587 RepID=A0A8H5AXQ5_9AGAR|nr:hypothetical protein D9619_003515 [Psilocybe cf. subviscida]
MLQRSHEAGLSVCIDLSDIQSSVLSQVLGQAHRLAHLTLENSLIDQHLEKFFVESGPLYVPKLQTLWLNGRAYGPIGPPVPDMLFHGMVKLRHLGLSWMDISWDSHLFKDLTTLFLKDIATKPSWSQLRSTLQKMPELQSLTIEGTLPSGTPDATFITSPVYLPSLRIMCINDEAVKCRSFFHLISFSDCLENSTCTVSIGDQETAVGICDLLLSANRSASGKSLSASTQSLFIEGTLWDTELRLSFTTSNGSWNPTTLDYTCRSTVNDLPGLKFLIWEQTTRWRKGDDDIYNKIFSGVLQASRFQALLELDLSCLSLSSPMPEFRDALAATFGTLPTLHNVFVGWKTVLFLVEILSIGSDEQGNCDMADNSDAPSSGRSGKNKDTDEGLEPGPTHLCSPIPFPALRNLTLCCVTFGSDDESDIELGPFKKCLIHRRNQGVGILTLVLEYCDQISSQDVAELEGLVPYVNLRRKNRDEESEEDLE